MKRSARVAAVVAAAVAAGGVALFMTAGDGDGGSGPTTTTTGVPRVVDGEPGDFEAITIDGGPCDDGCRRGDGPTDVTDLADDLVPLLAARRFEPPEPDAEYGLAQPRARLVFSRAAGPDVALDIGRTTVDEVFTYVRRRGERTVHLVLTDALARVIERLELGRETLPIDPANNQERVVGAGQAPR
jgi:hypothetical protein